MIDFLSFAIIFVISLYIPIIFGFDIEPGDSGLKYFELMMDIWFMIEMVLNFFTGYHVKGQLVTKKKKIACNYLKSWLVPDLISSLPFSILYFTNMNVTNLSKA